MTLLVQKSVCGLISRLYASVKTERDARQVHLCSAGHQKREQSYLLCPVLIVEAIVGRHGRKHSGQAHWFYID